MISKKQKRAVARKKRTLLLLEIRKCKRLLKALDKDLKSYSQTSSDDSKS